MNIGKAAKITGLTEKMIRYYEDIGLIPKVYRTESGYRDYQEQDIARLKFIYNARQLGFSLAHIQELLTLRQNQQRHSADVKYIAEQHLQQLKEKIHQMQELADELQHLIHCCANNDQPDCAILNQIEYTNKHPCCDH